MEEDYEKERKNRAKTKSGSFRYDRNLNGTLGDDTVNVMLDLFGKDTSATIADAIAARGYVPPSF